MNDKDKQEFEKWFKDYWDFQLYLMVILTLEGKLFI
jgi:hypothetical protein